MKLRRTFQFLIGVGCATAWAGKSFTWTLDSAGRRQAEFYADAYYTALNFTQTLTDQPIPRLSHQGERAVYWDLVSRLPHPREVLVEASVNPLPLGGWALRSGAPDLHRQASWGDVNVVEALTQGFPEPWAVSLFWGNVVNLVNEPDTGKVHGVAYAGVLFSAGLQHLWANRMVSTPWLEAEFKVKGDDLRPGRKLGWSFRAGTRRYQDERIDDSWYVSLVRRRTDFRESGWKLLRNGNIEMRLDLRERGPALLSAGLVVGKKWPFGRGEKAFTLNAGAVRTFNTPYRDDLFRQEVEGWRFVLRPNLEF